MMRAAARVALLAGLIACAKPEPPAPAPLIHAPVRTDRPRYELRDGPHGPETTIVATFTAPADRPAYLANCNGAITLGLQRPERGTWVDAWIAEINGCASTPIVISAGSSYTSPMTPYRIPAGTYRAVFFNMHQASGEELPLEQRVSAPFRIDP